MSQQKISRRAALKLSVFSGLGLTLPAPDFFGMKNEALGNAGQLDQNWAIVVGIQNYPNLVKQIGQEALKGPVNDARAFYSWVTAAPPLGGGVPLGNAALFDQPCQQCAASVNATCPNKECIEHELNKYLDIAQENANQMLGERIGRRLYLYLAGHGIEPNGGPALLVADAGVNKFVRHVPGRRYADWFYNAAYFDEIVLFMDCCRDNAWTTSPCSLIFDPKFGPINGLKYFYAFATKWNRRSRERDFGGGEYHGIFTKALLEGLQGAASDPDTETITAGSLEDYLHHSIAEFLGPDLATLPAPEVEPDIMREPQSGDGFVISKAAPKLYPVVLQLSPAAMGKVVTVLTSSRKSGIVTRWKGQPVGASQSLTLSRGLYYVEYADGSSKNFQVPVPKGSSVQL